MRSTLRVLGLLGAAAVALLVAVYNYHTSGGGTAGVLMALRWVLITLMALGLPVFAFYIWFFNRTVSLVLWVFAICAGALSILCNNLMVMAHALGAALDWSPETVLAGSAVVHLIPIYLLLSGGIGRQEERQPSQDVRVRKAQSAPLHQRNRPDSEEDGISAVLRTVTFLLEPARGQRVDLATIYGRYHAESLKEGRQPAQSIFEDAVCALCAATAIGVQIANKKVYLSGVKIVG